MALALRMNGAPLSGALFVSNPAPRKAKANTAKAKIKANRRNGRKRRTSARKRRGLAARAKAALAFRANRAGRKARAKSGGLLARALRRLRARRNASHMGRVFGGGAVIGKAKANRKRRKSRKARRNIALATYANRRNGRTHARRNSATFDNALTAPVAGVVRKVPVVGSLLSGFVAPLVVGAVVGAVHYYGVKAATAVAPKVVQALDPVKFSAAGLAVGGLMAVSGKIPGLNRVPANLRSQIGVAAVLVGGALDVFRALNRSMGDLSDAVPLYDYSDAMPLYQTADAVTLPGYAGAVPLYDYSGLAVESSALGDGFAYDVVPGAALSNYGAASPGDAAAAPDDLSVEEGEAALAGADAWMETFGPVPVTRTRREGGYYSTLAGRPGHRFGWLIQLVGFDRFQRIAALPPAERCALIARLKTEAIQIADQSRAQDAAPSLSGIALDLGAHMFAGSHV